MAKEFLVMGDLNINYNKLVYGSVFGVNDSLPGNWINASCVGSQFDIDQEGPGNIDYCGKPMR